MADNLIRKGIATRLRELRAEKGWTQEQAARNIDCSWRALQRWERGHAQPTWESVQMLARGYNVTPSQLIGQEPLRGKPDSLEARVDQLTLKVSQLETQLNNLFQRERWKHQLQDPDDEVEI